MMLFTQPGEFFHMFWEALGPILLPMLVGSLPIGGTVGVIMYFLVYKAVARYQERRRERLELRRRQLQGQAAE